MLRQAWRVTRTVPISHPFLFGTGLAGFKSGCCDIIVQKTMDKNEQLNWRRVTVFATFGSTFSGAWQYFLFVRLLPRLCPAAEAFAKKPIREKIKDVPGLKALFVQLAVDNGINNPILYFPIFYTVKEFIEGGDLKDGIKKYKTHFKEDVIAIWKVWIPAQFINFAFSPLWLRVPFVAVVSAFWTGYVSMTRGKREVLEDVEEEKASQTDSV